MTPERFKEIRQAAAKKGAATLRERYGEDYFEVKGRKGGKAYRPNRGYAAMTPEQRKEYGRLGGRTRKETT